MLRVTYKKTELDLLMKTAFNPDLTLFEAWRHIYYFGRFVHARQKTMNWAEKQAYFYEKGQQDFVMLRFRDQLKNL